MFLLGRCVPGELRIVLESVYEVVCEECVEACDQEPSLASFEAL